MNHYTFKHACEICDSSPVLKATDLCAVCTFGEADSMWEWLNENWIGKELKLAKSYLKDIIKKMHAGNISFKNDIQKRVSEILLSND